MLRQVPHKKIGSGKRFVVSELQLEDCFGPEKDNGGTKRAGTCLLLAGRVPLSRGKAGLEKNVLFKLQNEGENVFRKILNTRVLQKFSKFRRN